MYQRLLLLLNVLFISGTLMAQDVMTSSDPDNIYNPSATLGSATNPIPLGGSVVQKWVHDTSQTHNKRIPWDQTMFKSYRYGTLSFRLRFPKNYDPANNKYPLIIFFHGAGEACDTANTRNKNLVNRENQDQLYWGASDFSNAIENGSWNGFLLFPQLFEGSTEWDAYKLPPVINILDTLIKYNSVDIDRVIGMGLSAGGLGSLTFADLYPTRAATIISSSPEQIQGLNSEISSFLQIPLWISAGGIDINPDPGNVLLFRDNFGAAGGDIYLNYHPTSGHETWPTQWIKTDYNNNRILYSYWNNAHKAQPLLYFQNNQFCADSPINAKMGITAGFYAYEWQMSNGGGFTTIGGAISNTYTATQAGSYRVHFKRTATSNWSDWSPKPIAISTKACSADTAFVEHFNSSPSTYFTTFPGSGGGFTGVSSYNALNTTCQNGITTNATEVFSQDALLNKNSRFLLHNTTPSVIKKDRNGNITSATCEYHVNDQVWRTMDTWPVTPNTDYTFSFYMGNQSTNVSIATKSPLALIVPYINDAPLASLTGVSAVLQGDLSWKKYSYTWNSGSNTYAYFALRDQTATGSGAEGNDFVIDEISLVKSKPAPMPGYAFRNMTMWAKADAMNMNNDGAPLGVWTNSDINGNSLQQTDVTAQPLLNNNASSNINFNPVVTYANATAKTMFVTKGFSGTATHSSVYAYVVSNFKTLPNNYANLLRERQSSSRRVAIQFLNTGKINWIAGSLSADSIETNNNINEAGKPILWSFSKSASLTASGNKQDIRKNGIVVASSNSALATSSFTGNSSDLRIGKIIKTQTNGETDPRDGFDGGIAEIIYMMDSVVTPVRQNLIESYLATKYGTTLGNTSSPISYTASDSATVFWPASAIYQNDVFGIGKDSLSALLQLQSNSANSGSGNGTGQSAKGNLVLSTNATTTLDDKDFLMIGNDAGTLNQSLITTGQAASTAVGSTRVGRRWKVVNTGNIGKVDLSFDTTGLGPQVGGAVVNNYALMIDNDGDGNFATGTTTFFTAKSASGKKIFFTGATLNNGVVFTIITNLANALPAVWLGFTADAVNGDALLNWKTSNEINVDHYVVEHSYNGVSFSVIANVTANNNTGVNNYSYTDKGLAAGVHYYRIRRIDKDGKAEYSETKTVKIATAGANVQIRPNPVVGSTLALAVAVPQASKTMVQIMSVDGKVLMQKQINLAMGSNLVTLDVSYVPAGVYLLQVQLKDGAVTQKFIRQH